ncbi:Condensin complex subunit 1 [Sarcoptes scabiei]|uniref:Condensin complex subunit 1 n=1 Tax=Sarcoptes scabiei TaxID=52283 RepID=A0A834VFQ5_SARSC|nr:Condensin complex subunit 1 [Sarcoptes scabiei]
MSLQNSSFVFKIPDRLEDLENESEFYTISRSKIHHHSELSNLLSNAAADYRSNGINFIFDHFDCLYYVCRHFQKVEASVKKQAWDLLNRSMISLYTELSQFFNHFQIGHRLEYQNKLQMICYLTLAMNEILEVENSKTGTTEYNENKGKKNEKFDVVKSYQFHRAQSLSTLLQILSLKLDKLFDPAYFLSNFINIATRWVYKIIEHNNRISNTVLFTHICDIISIALDRYDHGINYYMKIIELLQTKETLDKPLARMVAKNIESLPHLFIINDIIDQIKSIDINILSRDNSAPKAIIGFLDELTKLRPNDMYRNVSDLFEFLDQDHYLLRNVTLSIFSTIIIEKFKNPTLFKEIHIKNKLLDKLEAHIHDTISMTRSKVLQLWHDLAKAEAIPIKRLSLVTKMILERLKDKSCYVRKSALHFVTSMLENNLFDMMTKKQMLQALNRVREMQSRLRTEIDDEIPGNNDQIEEQSIDPQNVSADDVDQFSNTENESENDEEDEIVLKTRKRKSRDPDEAIDKDKKKLKQEFEAISKIAKTWIDLEKQFIEFWRKKGSEIKNDLYVSLKFPEDLPDDLDQGLEMFRNLLMDRKFEKALIVLFSLKSIYSHQEIFKLAKSNCLNEIDDDDDCNENDNSIGNIHDYNMKDAEQCVTNSQTDISDLNCFISSVTNFSSKTMDKLCYELSLAKNVFLEPLINFGNKVLMNQTQNESNSLMQQIILKQQSDRQEEDPRNVCLKKLNDLVERLELALQIFENISKSIPLINSFLDSRNITDILEAINFFTFAYKMEIDNAECGLQKMLKLIFNKEKTIQEALLRAFTEIYLNFPEIDDPNQYDQNHFYHLQIRHLSNMIAKLNQGELVCVERLIRELFQAKKFNQIHVRILWERYAMKYSNLNEDDSRIALVIIGMLAFAQPELIREPKNLNNIIVVSFQQLRHNDHLVADTCDVILKSFQLPQTDKMEYFFKLPNDHNLFQHLHQIMVDKIIDNKTKYWNLISQRTVKIFYFLAEKPDTLVSSLLKDCYTKIVNSARDNVFAENGSEIDQPSSQFTSTTASSQSDRIDILNNIDDVILSHFIAILGDVAVNLLIHLDLHVMKELKIRQHIKDKENQSKISNDLISRKSKISKMNSIESNEDDELNEIVGPNSNEEPHQEKIIEVCNEAVLFDRGILSKFSDLVERFASDFDGSSYSYPLRQSASLTMAKFMVLSKKDGNIRSNAIISFGDLLVRFPNEIEHHTGKIFDCLFDKDFQVRCNALKVLTRLILADMIKPKNNISKIAQLIIDKDNFLSSTAKLFFVSLGKKNNVYIYNYLPDIISNLSGDNKMDEPDFKEMIKFLFELLEKTRNTESLVTKLCHRFTNTTDERVWRDVSFCLSQLQYNERALSNLIDNFSLFSNTLYCDEVFSNITSIIANIRKDGKLKKETLASLEEMEQKISQARIKGTEIAQSERTVDTGASESMIEEGTAMEE